MPVPAQTYVLQRPKGTLRPGGTRDTSRPVGCMRGLGCGETSLGLRLKSDVNLDAVKRRRSPEIQHKGDAL